MSHGAPTPVLLVAGVGSSAAGKRDPTRQQSAFFQGVSPFQATTPAINAHDPSVRGARTLPVIRVRHAPTPMPRRTTESYDDASHPWHGPNSS